jgi:hypothetical protein
VTWSQLAGLTALGWGGMVLFCLLWIEERRYRKQWEEWAGIIGRHANEMWEELRRQKLPKEPPDLSESKTLAMPRDQLWARLTGGGRPRFKMTGDK